MKKIMPPLIAVLYLLLPCINLQAGNKLIDADLQRLDSAVANSHDFDVRKMEEIAAFKRSAHLVNTPEGQYNFYQHLFDEYMKFDPDSAIYYARKAKGAAQAGGLRVEAVNAMIDEARELTLQGNLLKAQTLFQEIGDIQSVPESVRTDLAMTYMEFSIRTLVCNFEGSATMSSKEVWHTYNKYLTPDMWQYHYYASLLAQEDHYKQLLHEARTMEQPSLEAAMVYIALSQMSWQRKDIDNYLHYLILSAINDISCSNREASSLQYLVNSPHLQLDADRAFRYTMLCTETANIFQDQSKSINVVKAHAKVTAAYQQKLERRTHILYVIIALLAVALVAVGWLARTVAHKRSLLEKLLEKVEQMKDKLAQSNTLLKTEVSYHNQNFFNVYHLISKYISDVGEFKKMVYNLITVGKYDKARRELGSNSNTDKYLKSFFEHFDKAFLLSHPDFVERFNALLRPEGRISQPAPDVLTPELRIYALVSIGITDSVSIAQFLHYSTQTVYNYRLRVRHSAVIPEKHFAETVAKLYENDEEQLSEKERIRN